MAGLAAASPAARAATPLATLRYSSDITVDLSGTILTPAEVAEDDLAGTVIPVDIGALPPDVHVDAYHLLPNGDQLLSFDTAVELPGGDVADPADVVRFNGSAYDILLDAAEGGVPDGVNVDAVAVSGDDLLVSFDVAVRLGDTTFEDEDLVRVTDTVPRFTRFFTGADAGVPEELDLDGARVLSDTRLLVSFDGSGVLGGVEFDDEDVLEYDGGGGTWERVYDGSAHHAGLADGDLVGLFAVPIVVASPTPTATSAPTGAPTHTATATTSTTMTASPATATATPIVTGTASPPATSTPPTSGCVGDCDDSGEVGINELITMVNIALGARPVADCLAGDPSGDNAISIDELIQAVNNALTGC